MMQNNLEALTTVYRAVANLVLVLDEIVLDHRKAEHFAAMTKDEWASVEKIFQELFAACDVYRDINQEVLRDQIVKEHTA